MEGLLLAHTLRSLAPQLPARTSGWVFPDETTAAVLLEGVGNLVFSYRPPGPALYLTREKLSGEPGSPFQRTLAARVKGELLRAQQLKLDRVAQLHFGGEGGFVDVPPARLLFELTGRNANVLLLEDGEGWEGRILAAAREVTGTRNRFRVVRTGGRYTPPPPYDKLDPRAMTEGDARALDGLPLSRWKDKVDGLGLTLSAELARRANLDPTEAPGERWPQVLAALRSLVEDPSVAEGTAAGNVREGAREQKAEALRKSLREPLQKRLALVRNQLGDVERAGRGALEAERERAWADLLLAYQWQVFPGAASAELPRFDGQGSEVIPLEPQLSAVQNAEKLYTRAKRRLEVHARLLEREPALRAELEEARRQLDDLEGADLPTLTRLEAELISPAGAKPAAGLRFKSPSGLDVLVGRNNKENDLITRRIARSTDYWFHAQGYPGSHVLVRSGGRDLPLPDILMAAALAAQYSKARGGGNVAVDYTQVKNVWKPRGAPAGQALYTQQKTVFVDPALPGGT